VAGDLFKAMAPLKKKWVSHPILDDDEVLKLAADAGPGTCTRRFSTPPT